MRGIFNRGGGANQASNSLLAVLMQKVNELYLPREIVECNVKKALNECQEAFMEKLYEVHGSGRADKIAEFLTEF